MVDSTGNHESRDRSAPAESVTGNPWARDTLILNGIRDAVALTDLAGRVTFWNEGAARLFGCPTEDALGHSLADRFPPHLRDAVASGEFTGQFHLGNAEPSGIWIEARLRRVTDPAGKEAGLLALAYDITDRKRAADTLRRQEEFQRDVLDSMPAHVAVIDATGMIRSVNRAWRRFAEENAAPGLDVAANTGVGTNYLDACRDNGSPHGRDAVAAGVGIREVLQGLRPRFDLQYPCNTPDRKRWFHLSVTPLGTGQRGAVVAHFDITEAKQAEAALIGQNRVLESIAGGAPLPEVLEAIIRLVEERLPESLCSILILDEANRRLHFGAGRSLPAAYIAAVDGIPVGPGEGSCGTAAHRGAAVMVDDIATDPLWTQYRAVALAHGLRSCFSVPVFASASPTLAESHPRVIGTFALYRRTPGEAAVGAAGALAIAAHLAGVAIERDTAQHDLRENRERFRLLVEGVRDYAIFLADHAGTVVTWNSGAERAYGYPGAEAVGGHVDRFFPAEDRSSGRAGTHLARAAESGRMEFEGWLERKNRSRFWAGTVITALRHGNGCLRGYAFVVRDLTERRRLEEQLRQSQKMEAVGLLAGGVAHDFNNLLTVINGHGAMLLADLPGTDPRADSALAILDAGRRAAALTGQLLAFSRKAIVEPVVLDLNRIVDSIGQLLRRLIGEDIRLVTRLAPAIGPVKIDPGQLEQVIINLALNARDAMPTGGHLTIETAELTFAESASSESAEVRPGRYAQLALSDTGCGMPDEIKTRVFEPFFTTKPVGKGTGLGLATVYGIVRQAGGDISVESTVGHGTTFRVWLPITAESPLARGTAPPSPVSPRGTETILLAEDDEEVRRLVRLALAQLGYQVLETGSGQEAIRAAENHPGVIHLLVADVVMPDFGGPRLAAAIRANRPGIRVLYISGYTEDAVLRHGLEAGSASAESMLPKPFTPVMLAQKIRRVLDAG